MLFQLQISSIFDSAILFSHAMVYISYNYYKRNGKFVLRTNFPQRRASPLRYGAHLWVVRIGSDSLNHRQQPQRCWWPGCFSFETGRTYPACLPGTAYVPCVFAMRRLGTSAPSGPSSNHLLEPDVNSHRCVNLLKVQ